MLWCGILYRSGDLLDALERKGDPRGDGAAFDGSWGLSTASAIYLVRYFFFADCSHSWAFLGLDLHFAQLLLRLCSRPGYLPQSLSPFLPHSLRFHPRFPPRFHLHFRPPLELLPSLLRLLPLSPFPVFP